MTPAQEARPRAYAFALVPPLLVALASGNACMETRRSLGEDCLKDDDCLSGVCSQLRCAASPPTIDAQVTHANAGDDATTDGPTETTADKGVGDVAVETASETSAASSLDAAVDGDDTGD